MKDLNKKQTRMKGDTCLWVTMLCACISFTATRSSEQHPGINECSVSREELLKMPIQDAFSILLEMHSDICDVDSHGLGGLENGIYDHSHNVEPVPNDNPHNQDERQKPFVRGTVLSNQRAELMKLFDATYGASWNRKNYWGTNVPICSWFGVICQSECNSILIQENQCPVVGLRLQGNGLKGIMPVLNIPSLDTVDFAFNQLTGIEPGFSLPMLTILKLLYNYFKEFTTEIDLPMLQYLDLDENVLSDLHTSISFPNLEDLYLSGNQIQGGLPGWDYPNLLTLDVSSNYLTGKLNIGNIFL